MERQQSRRSKYFQRLKSEKGLEFERKKREIKNSIFENVNGSLFPYLR